MFSLLELRMQKWVQQQGIYPALHVGNYLSFIQCRAEELWIQSPVWIWESSTTASLQNHIFKEDYWMCEPICELLASSVALIIFPLKYQMPNTHSSGQNLDMATRHSGFCPCFNFSYIFWPCINNLLPVNHFLYLGHQKMMLQTPQKLLWKNTIAFIWCYRIHEIPTYTSHLTGPCPVVIYDHMVTASRGGDRRSLYYQMATSLSPEP